MTESRYEYYKRYKVEAKSVVDFLKRYTNYNTTQQQVAPHEVRLKSYQEELDKNGFCYMPKFMSVTGRPVTYYPPPKGED
jgi:hypothetical protein